MNRPHRAARWVSVLAIAATACGGKSGPTEPQVATALGIQAGDGQTGAVGAALTNKLLVVATNGSSPVANVVVTAAANGGGSLAPASATTDASGTAQFTWTLGSTVGPQTATFTTNTTVTKTANATATPGAATVIVPVSNAFQLVVVNRLVPAQPKVQVTDAFGNALSGVTVTFDAPVAGSVLAGATATTDAGGFATLGSWTIGPDPLVYNVRGRLASGAIALFEARGVPAAVTHVAGSGQSGNICAAVPITPAVKAVRDDASPIAGVQVTFVVTGGNGSVQGGSALTGADGIARPTKWILGTAPGPNTLEAQVFGAPPVPFTATGITAVPAALVTVGSTTFSGFFGNFLAAAPTVELRDAGGGPVACAGVTFQVIAGDGAVFNATQTTNANGQATLGAWRLGNAASSTVQASATGIAPVTFTATGTTAPASTFKIEVRYRNGTPSASQKAAFDQAVARWTSLIIGGAPPYLVVPSDSDPSGTCPAMTGETVDGVVIYADLKPIDGVNNILGSTGVCVVRDVGFLPVQSLMIFDTADLTALETSGALNAVILHEMAHALGYGTVWNFDAGTLGHQQFAIGIPGTDPTFIGAGARAGMFGAIATGTAFTGTPVPLENTGGSGTIYSHWRESTFGSEVLTGFLNNGVNPLSAMSVQQFRDIGYTVNDALADPYTFQAHLQSIFGTQIPLNEAPLPGSVTVINRRGGVVARVPRTRF